MNKKIPVASRIIQNKSLERDQQIHRQNLYNMRSTFQKGCRVNNNNNNSSNSNAFFIINKKKRDQLLESRYTEIERENRILLEKITNIMQFKSGNAVSSKVCPSPKSLNHGQRKKQLIKIAQENHHLLKRLQERKSAYNVHTWDQQFRKTRTFLNNISMFTRSPKGQMAPQQNMNLQNYFFQQQQQPNQYQLPNNPPFHQQQRPDTTNPRIRYNEKLANIVNPQQKLNSRGQYSSGIKQRQRGFSNYVKQNQTFDLNNNNNQRDQSLNLNQTNNLQVQEDDQLNEDNYNLGSRDTQYSKTKKISGVYYQIEIAFANNKMLIIAEEVDGNEIKVIEIPEKEALEYLRDECDNDFESLTLRLRVQNKKLYLIGTKQPANQQEEESYDKQNTNKKSSTQNVVSQVTEQQYKALSGQNNQSGEEKRIYSAQERPRKMHFEEMKGNQGVYQNNSIGLNNQQQGYQKPKQDLNQEDNYNDREAIEEEADMQVENVSQPNKANINNNAKQIMNKNADSKTAPDKEQQQPNQSSNQNKENVFKLNLQNSHHESEQQTPKYGDSLINNSN